MSPTPPNTPKKRSKHSHHQYSGVGWHPPLAVRHDGEDSRDNDKEEIHSGLSSHRMVVRMHKPLKNLVGSRNLLYTSYNNSSLGQGGSQLVYDAFIIGSVTQWLNSTSGATKPNFDQGEVAYFDLNPSRGNTGSRVISASTAPAIDRYAHVKSHIKLDVTNVTSFATQYEVMVFACKRNTSIAPTALATTFFTAEGMGLSAATAPAAGLSTSSSYGALGPNFPYMSIQRAKGLSDFWTLKGTKSLHLAAAASESLTIDIMVNKIAKYEDLANSPASYYAGLTYCVTVRQLAAPTVDAGTGVVGHAISKTAWIANMIHTFKGVKAGAQRFSDSIGYTVEPFGTTAANLKEVSATDTSITELIL